MKKILLFGLLLVGNYLMAQTVVYTQDFEIENSGYSTSATEGSSTSFIDIFNRSQPNIGGNSTFLFAIEDTNVTPATINLSNIDVSNLSDFTFSIDLLAHHYQDWDSTDEVLITYSLDGGVFQNLMSIQHVPNDASNEPAALDTNFDGDGECTPTTLLPSLTTGTSNGCVVPANDNQFRNFSSDTILLNGNSSLTILFTVNGLTATDEGVYFDNISIQGNPSGPLTTSIQFDPNALTVNEDAGTVDLTVSISNESATTATTVDVVLTSGTASNIGNYMTQALNFPAGSSTSQTVTVTVTDDMLAEMDEDFVFELQNIQGGDMAAAGLNSQFTLTVLEDDVALYHYLIQNHLMIVQIMHGSLLMRLVMMNGFVVQVHIL
nr:Calx-beta domain-containing protein [Nonlabens ulvanivorans]